MHRPSAFPVLLFPLLALAALTGPLLAQRQMERLGRGVLAVRKTSPTSQVYVGWRLLGNDPPDIAFHVYRSDNGGAPVRLTATPLTSTTDYIDTPPNFSVTHQYSVRPVLSGVEVPDTWANTAAAPPVLPVNVTARQYLPIPLQPTPDGAHNVKFCWVGDLDGDGEYDFVVDRHHATLADQRQFLEGYKRDGTLLWRVNMGPNSTNHYHIEPGSSAISTGHSDEVTVYDLDGDGKAEVVLRTANGVVLGDGAVVTDADDRKQFLSILNGLTGAERARAPIPNPWLSDGPLSGHMGIAYFDGMKPSVLLAAKNRRDDLGFQGLTTTWDFRAGSLTQRWSYSADLLNQHAPEGHQIRLGDVDNDGKDEFLDIGYAIDDNGTQLFNIPEAVHGDRFHLADIDPDRPGLETYAIQQNNGSGLATFLFDPANGKFLKKWYAGGVVDVGRGLAADIDPARKGLEMFSTQPGIYDCKGARIEAYGTSHPFPPEAVWWDGNLSREFLATVGATAEAPAIARFDPAYPDSQSRIYTIYNQTAPGVYWAYGGRPAFWGDILGDWREEVITVANDNSELRIYTTTSAAQNRLYTLMQNPQYRIQATAKGYVQASYVDYYLGDGMTVPQPPPMVDAKLVWRGGAGTSTWNSGTTASWLNGSGAPATFAAGDAVRFDIGSNATTPVVLSGTLSPGAVTFYSPKSHVVDGAAGSWAGAMKLTKAGAGSLTLSGSHAFTGSTTVWDGALILNGTLSQSPVTVWGGTWGGAAAAGLTGGRLGGTGTVSKAVTLGYRGTITPGAGMGAAGTLTLGGGLTAQDGSCLAFDLSDNPSGTVKPHDRLNITGNLNLSGSVALVINPLHGQLPPGDYTLATWTGSLTGSAANFSVSVPPGTPHTLTVSGGVVKLTVPVTRAAASVTWRGTGSSWDLATSQTWLRAAAPDVFVAGDTVLFDSTGAAAPTVTLSSALPVAGVTVNAAGDYVFSGPGFITGGGGLTKTGVGTLTVNTLNACTGPTLVQGGVLAVNTLSDAGEPGGIGSASGAASNLQINGGTLRVTGLQANTDRSLTLGSAGGGIEVSSAGGFVQISGSLTGPGSLTKTGPGTLILANANTFSGGTVINAGTLYLAGTTANVSGLGSGAVTLNNGTLTMANVQDSGTAAWNLIVPAGATGRLNADGRCTLTGSLTGGGTLHYYSPYVRSDLKGNWSGFTGTINVVGGGDGGEMRVATASGYAGATLNLSADSYLYSTLTSSGVVLEVGALSGEATSGMGGGAVAGRTLTWRVGGKNTDAVFAGSIVNGTGPTAITKTGTGIWTLSGVSTHTGATTVAAGTLRLEGSTTGSNITVQSSAVLGGGGAVTGNVNFHSGAVLEHRELASVPLKVTGDLTLGAALTVRPQPGALLQPGVYTVLTYTGNLSGTSAVSWQPPAGSNLAGTFSLAEPGRLTMTLTEVLTPFQQWQLAQFGSTTAAGAQAGADPDRDGTTNLAEFRLGLNPKNSASWFHASATWVSGKPLLAWAAVPGLRFSIQRSTSLTGTWQTLTTVTAATTTAVFTDATPPPGRGFYRVVLLD